MPSKRDVLALLPRNDLLDYVEHCHLAHNDHTRGFSSMLGRVMPDYDARKVALRVLGPRLE